MARILVIDGDVGMLQVMSDYLLEQGHETTLCQSALKAVERMHTFEPDVITTNLRIENGGNCFDVLRECREHYPPPPVVVMSGCDTVETITEVMKQGAFEYLVKPVKANDLQRTIERAMDVRRAAVGNAFQNGSLKEAGASQMSGAAIQNRDRSPMPRGPRLMKEQKVALVVAIILLAGAWLFPPWIHCQRPGAGSHEIKHPAGYFFLFDIQQDENPDTLQSTTANIDFGRLSGESVVAAAIGCGLMAVLRRKRGML